MVPGRVRRALGVVTCLHRVCHGALAHRASTSFSSGFFSVCFGQAVLLLLLFLAFIYPL